jgi:4,4'-diapophytoene synthase
MTTTNLAYCRQVLPKVSRTFALGINILHDPLRNAVCVSYLICRILDTIEDTTTLPVEDRAILLDRAGRELTDPNRWEECSRAIRKSFIGAGFPSPDHDLCRHCGRVLEAFHSFPFPLRDAVIGPVREMAEGMAETVRRELNDGGLSLETIDDLKRYCYYVAGTVGNMLTNLFSLDRDSITIDIRDRLRYYGPRFGLGLQLTNIIKGVTDDNSRGVSYLPRQLLTESGITIPELLKQPGDPRGRQLISRLISLALSGLDDALEYMLTLPPQETDLRLFCALPLIFAVRTLALAGRTTAVFGEEPLKISRGEIAAIYLRLEAICGKDDELRKTYRKEKQGISSTE